MRCHDLALAPLILAATAMLAHAQTSLPKKSPRVRKANTVWAASYTEPSSAPIEAAPAMSSTGSTAPRTPPATLSAPVVETSSLPVEGNGCGNSKHGHLKGCCERILNWFCYRPSRSCAKGCPCNYWCHRPLYVYFLQPCKEGATHTTQEPSSCKGNGCGGSKTFATGHRMFAMPTGHGVPGIP